MPQFYNVLKGDMSIVGPRPWIPEYYNNFEEYQKKRVDVLPGIIGLAQVKGRRDIDVFQKIEYDLEYVENVNFILDLKIFFQIVSVIISNESINSADYVAHEIKMLKENKESKKS